jgi:cell division protein FtsB
LKTLPTPAKRPPADRGSRLSNADEMNYATAMLSSRMSSLSLIRRAARYRSWSEVRTTLTAVSILANHPPTLATNHIVLLEKANQELKARINALEQEMTRLRAINEKISLGNTDLTPGFEGKPLPDASATTPPASGQVKMQRSTPERPSSAVPSDHEQL